MQKLKNNRLPDLSSGLKILILLVLCFQTTSLWAEWQQEPPAAQSFRWRLAIAWGLALLGAGLYVVLPAVSFLLLFIAGGWAVSAIALFFNRNKKIRQGLRLWAYSLCSLLFYIGASFGSYWLILTAPGYSIYFALMSLSLHLFLSLIFLGILVYALWLWPYLEARD